MTLDEFQKLPLKSRRAIEERIVGLDLAVQQEYGFSMFDTEKRIIRKVNESDNVEVPQFELKPSSLT